MSLAEWHTGAAAKRETHSVANWDMLARGKVRIWRPSEIGLRLRLVQVVITMVNVLPFSHIFITKHKPELYIYLAI